MGKKSVFELIDENHWQEKFEDFCLTGEEREEMNKLKQIGEGIALNLSELRTLKSISMAEEVHRSSPFKPVDISCNLGSLSVEDVIIDSEKAMMEANQKGLRRLNTVCTELNPMEKPKNFKELMEASRNLSAMYREYVGKMKGVKS